ncbi:unnamed protein product, partial [Amoebophrya sp. A25]
RCGGCARKNAPPKLVAKWLNVHHIIIIYKEEASGIQRFISCILEIKSVMMWMIDYVCTNLGQGRLLIPMRMKKAPPS